MLTREEQQEYADFVDNYLHDFSLMTKIHKKIRNLFISRSRMNDLRGRFIQRTEPFFVDYIKKSSGNDNFITDLQIRYFEKRVRTLPRDALLRLIEEYDKINRVKSDKVREKLLNYFYHSLNLSYSMNGWFLKLYADELKKKL
jgi:hypothetical protein